MYQLICRIWLEESMSNDWNLSDLSAVLKKGHDMPQLSGHKPYERIVCKIEDPRQGTDWILSVRFQTWLADMRHENQDKTF